jgi:hypothetical protein
MDPGKKLYYHIWDEEKNEYAGNFSGAAAMDGRQPELPRSSTCCRKTEDLRKNGAVWQRSH